MGKRNNNTIRIGGEKFEIGSKLGPGEVRKIERDTGKSAPQIVNQASNQNVAVSSAAQNYVQQFIPSPPPAPSPPLPSQSSSPAPSFGGSGGGYVDYGGFNESFLPENFINAPMYAAAQTGANLETQRQLEEIRQAGSTERQRLIKETTLLATDKEVAGKLDLQKIVNAGYKNIANIERGSDMFASIMSAFNF